MAETYVMSTYPKFNACLMPKENPINLYIHVEVEVGYLGSNVQDRRLELRIHVLYTSICRLRLLKESKCRAEVVAVVSIKGSGLTVNGNHI
jgi:hypothetical protein